VVDDAGNPVEGATVTIASLKAGKTDKSGVASFVNVTSGAHDVTVQSITGAAKQKITVSKQSPTSVQQFQVKVAAATYLTWTLTILLLVVILLIGGGGLWIWRGKVNPLSFFGGGASSMAPAMVGNAPATPVATPTAVVNPAPGFAPATSVPVTSAPPAAPVPPAAPAASGGMQPTIVYPTQPLDDSADKPAV
jgi:hypothetical protein